MSEQQQKRVHELVQRNIELRRMIQQKLDEISVFRDQIVKTNNKINELDRLKKQLLKELDWEPNDYIKD